jgi:hypothetical protein
MKKFMNIYDILRAPDGRAVTAGTDPNLDPLTIAEIRQLAGASVTIVTGTDSVRRVYSVLGVEASESLIGKKNVFLKLDIPFEDVKNLIGSVVMTGDDQI